MNSPHHAHALMQRRSLLRVLLGGLAGGAFVEARLQKSAAPEPSFSSNVNVVNVYATVRDKKGNLVTGLQKDDFVLAEEGKEREIRYFAKQTDLPLTLGLLVDTTPSESNMLEVERRASSLFFEEVLRPATDLAFLIQFADDVELLQDLTSSRDKLERSLESLGDSQAGGRGMGPNSTVLADAVYLGANDVLKQRTGRKAMIILGDGDHVGNREPDAVEAAQRADSLVYSIRIYDRDFGGNRGGGGWRGINIPGIPMPGGGPGGGGGPMGGPAGGPGGRGPGGMERSDGKRHLEDLARKTGGSYFEVTKKESLEQIYRKIEEELRSQYSLGFTPGDGAGGGYRHIKVTTRQKGLTVQAREGYFPIAVKS